MSWTEDKTLKYLKEQYLNETAEVEYVYIDPNEFDNWDAVQDVEDSSSINILRDKDPYILALVDGNPAACLWLGTDNHEFSFDVIVKPEYQKRGIAKHLIDDAISLYHSDFEDEGFIFKLDVVNEQLASYLKTKGFVVTNTVGGHILMELPLEEGTASHFLHKNNIDPNDLTWMGSGDFGNAYQTEDDRVLKKTRSSRELEIAMSIIGKDIPGLVKIHDAAHIDSEGWILMDMVDQSDMDTIESNFRRLLDDEESDEELDAFANQLQDIENAYRHLGVSIPDIRPENIGYDDAGDLVAFDLDDKDK